MKLCHMISFDERVVLENLIKLKICDCLGSVMTKEDGWREKLNYIKEIAIRENCYN